MAMPTGKPMRSKQRLTSIKASRLTERSPSTGLPAATMFKSCSRSYSLSPSTISRHATTNCWPCGAATSRSPGGFSRSPYRETGFVGQPETSRGRIGIVPTPEIADLTARLSRAGFIAAEEEANELLARGLTGEPLAWITGRVSFCGIEVQVDPGVYVPRWLTEPLARRAVERLPATGVAIHLCTGSGAIARGLSAERPGARVVASAVDERDVACAVASGVEVYRGDLFAPLPRMLKGRVDAVVGVVPYVPTPALPQLQRDTFAFESPLAYDGGPDGTEILHRVLRDSPRFLRRGGALLLELGGKQADLLRDDLTRLGYIDVRVLADDHGDVRGVEATLQFPPSGSRPPRQAG